MNLQLVNTGNLVPTCDANSVHTPLVWGFCGHDVRVILRPNTPVDRAMVFVQTDAAKALGYKCPVHAARSMGLTEPEDQGMELVSTPGGPQKMKVLTFKGLSKLLMRSDHKKALEFQNWLASKSSDLTFHGVAFADRPAANDPVMVSVNREMLKEICDESMAYHHLKANCVTRDEVVHVIQGMASLQSAMVQLAQAVYTKTARQLPSVPQLTPARRAEMARKKMLTAAAFLQQETGQASQPHSAASGLNSRTLHYCQDCCQGGNDSFSQFGIGRRPVTYFAADVLKVVYRNNWRKGQADPLKSGLFAADAARQAVSEAS